MREGYSKMPTNLELYGTEDVPKVPAEVCNQRLELLKERLEGLLSVHYMKWDNETMNKVQKAIVFWTKMRDGEEHE